MTQNKDKNTGGHQAFARKYRPQTFDELVGQDSVSETLKNAVSAGKIRHAYLFSGPRGTGKTTTARILAKALNCEKGPTPKPCGTCAPCREIAASSCLDVIEMDAASHTGVENIRANIIETVALSPTRDPRKIFIIDEVHMLSTPAFNALLKTLEEPPPQVVFILATTETAKIPPTITSRCQRFRFRPVPVDALSEHLKHLAAKEKISAEPAALRLLARCADGSLRDAVSLLDQCHSLGELTEKSVYEIFGLVQEDSLLALTQAVVEKDASALAATLRKLYAEGLEPARLLGDLRERLQAVYLAKLDAGEKLDKDWTAATERLTAADAAFLLRRLNRAFEDLKTGDSPRLALELGLFGCLEAAVDLKAWSERLERLEKRLAAGGPAQTASAAPQPPPPLRPAIKPSPAVSLAKPASEDSAIWRGALQALQQSRPGLAAALEKASFKVSGSSWKLSFAQSYELKAAERGLKEIEASLSTSAGRPISLSLDAASAAQTETGASSPPAANNPASPLPEGMVRAQSILGGTIRVVKKIPR